MVVGTLEVGGTENHVRQVLPHLKARGFDVSVAVLSDRGALAEDVERAGVTVWVPERLGWLTRDQQWWRRGLRLLTVAVWLWRLLRRERPEIVHTFLPEAYLVGGTIAFLARVPIRLMSRRSLDDYQRRRPALAPLERLLHRRMTGMAGNSAAVVRQLGAEVHDTGLTPRLIYNGIDDGAYATSADRALTRHALAIPGHALVLVIVANLIPYKGHADLITALSSIRDSLPAPWRLLCAGRDIGIGGDLANLCEDLRIAANVLWLGSRSDVPDLLAASDIGILCSHEEGFSNAILEGMAAGLPMVVTDVGGNAEAVVNGETGMVVPPRDPAALAAAVLALATNSQRRTELGRAGRARFEARFRLDQCVDAYVAWYSELLSARSHRREAVGQSSKPNIAFKVLRNDPQEKR